MWPPGMVKAMHLPKEQQTNKLLLLIVNKVTDRIRSLLDSLHNNGLLSWSEEGRRGGRRGEETMLKEEQLLFQTV